MKKPNKYSPSYRRASNRSGVIEEGLFDGLFAERVVYWLYERSSGQLLYVGYSRNLVNRLSDHQDKEWWSRVGCVEFKTFRTSEEALAAEAEAIVCEEPELNLHVPSREELVRLKQNSKRIRGGRQKLDGNGIYA